MDLQRQGSLRRYSAEQADQLEKIMSKNQSDNIVKNQSDIMGKNTKVIPAFPNFGTIAIHTGQDPDQFQHGQVVPPISMASTFMQVSPGEPKGDYGYSRSNNPCRYAFEKCLAAIEGVEYALAFASGQGAAMACMMMLRANDHILSSQDIYGGSNQLFTDVFWDQAYHVDFVDFTDLEAVESAIKPGKTKMVWIETPTNPTMTIIDIKAVSEIAHKHKDIIVVVDNTFMSPFFQRPVTLGADISYSSVTKYINGHSDVVMGGLAMNDQKLYKRLDFLQSSCGIVPSPFDCSQANRGAKTLHVRMERHAQNAMAVATFLEAHPLVEKVYYPGLKSHPQHDLVNKQCTGYGGMVSFRIKGTRETADTFLTNTKYFTLANSLGGVESLSALPIVMSHSSLTEEELELLEITDTLIRLSVGIETSQDLLDDIDHALKVACDKL